MPSRSRTLGTILLVLTDIAALAASFLVAYYLRFQSGLENLSPLSSTDGSGYFQLGLVITITAPFLFATSGMYKSTNLYFGLTEYVLALRASSLLVLVLVFASFAVGGAPIVSRTWIAIWVVVCVLFVVLGRFTARRIATLLRKRGAINETVLIVGADAQGVAIARQLITVTGVQVVGFLDEFLPVGTKIRNRFTILGSIRQIDSVAESTGVDSVLMIPAAISWESRQLLMLDSLRPRGSRKWQLHIAPGVYEMASLGAELGRVGNVPVLRLHVSSIVGTDAFIKRFLDIWITLGLLMIFLLPLLGIAAYLKLQGRRVLNRRLVTGLNGMPFVMNSLNFRTDVEGFPEGIERLPMLIHVLIGRMSIVGPRPRAISDPSNGNHPELLAVRPGVISVVPRTLVLSSNDEWSRIEATYTRNYSIWTDIALLMRAFLMGFKYVLPMTKTPPRMKADHSRVEIDD